MTSQAHSLDYIYNSSVSVLFSGADRWSVNLAVHEILHKVGQFWPDSQDLWSASFNQIPIIKI